MWPLSMDLYIFHFYVLPLSRRSTHRWGTDMKTKRCSRTSDRGGKSTEPGTCSDLVPVTPHPLPHKQETPTARGQITEWSMANRQIPKALVEYTFPWRPFIRNLEKWWSTEQMSRRNHDEGARVSYNKNMVVIYSTLSENVESNYTEAYIVLAN